MALCSVAVAGNGLTRSSSQNTPWMCSCEPLTSIKAFWVHMWTIEWICMQILAYMHQRMHILQEQTKCTLHAPHSQTCACSNHMKNRLVHNASPCSGQTESSCDWTASLLPQLHGHNFTVCCKLGESTVLSADTVYNTANCLVYWLSLLGKKCSSLLLFQLWIFHKFEILWSCF